ncbi:ribonuclease P protein component [Piscirickettsia salmonis]|uniref:ribonuclease P protein component n=2 Tax=Piscirickettsia salmonis TaxID=1238 RepID=UPI001E640A09|nr:ribonuclease P protein component [Piscirickettsia salmonis]
MTTKMPAKFSRSLRLLDARDFGLVFKNQRRISVRGFSLYHAASTSNLVVTSRLGLAVSKKHAKRAVSRNLIKRLIRESFRQQSDQLPKIDCVVVTRPDVTSLSRCELHQAINLLFERLRSLQLT